LVAFASVWETVEGGPRVGERLADLGLSDPHVLGVVLGVLVALIFGCLAAGPERVKAWVRHFRTAPASDTESAQADGPGNRPGHVEIGEARSRVVVHPLSFDPQRQHADPPLERGLREMDATIRQQWHEIKGERRAHERQRAEEQPENVRVAAFKTRQREEREPIIDRLRVLATKIEDHVDARAAVGPRWEPKPFQVQREVSHALSGGSPERRKYERQLAEYEHETVARYYLIIRQEAVDAMEAALRLGLATDGQVEEVRRPETAAKLAALPRMLRETADLLGRESAQS
jgi:hypothetical protein